MAAFLEEFQHLKIQLEDILSATNNFDDNKLIGIGGFGKVYKGELGRNMVAFKRLDSRFGQGGPEFWKEITMLTRYTHKNLISLLGFCDDGVEKILVYEHAFWGSLDRHLSSSDLTWTQRLKICLDAARGLCYLHDDKGTHQRIIHCDIKSSNILLDQNWNAKVSDMGLSKVGPANHLHTGLVTNVVGTIGYCDPLYMETYTLTKESDVYSFGVVLFEVLCGRLCYEHINGDTQIFVRLWKQSYEKNTLEEIIFQDLKRQMDPYSLETFSDIAFKCLHKSHEERPTMAHVVEKLEIALELQMLPERVMQVMDYEEVVKSATSPLQYRFEIPPKKLLLDGILLNRGKTNQFVDSNKLMATMNMRFGKYEIGGQIGHENFGKVYVARDIYTGQSVAMKVFEKEKMIKVGMMDRIEREISVLKMLPHPNIVHLYEVLASKSKIYLVMEFVGSSNLFSEIEKGRLQEGVARSYFQQLISVVDFCHRQGVYHRNLNLENLLLDSEGNLKVVDFGLGALVDHLRQDRLLHTMCGTPVYMAPEILGKKAYDGAKADIWSCGVILYILLAGFLPFHDENIVTMYRKIYQGGLKCPPWFSYDAQKLITKLLDPNPSSRITIGEIMGSAWYKNTEPKKLKTVTAFHIIQLSRAFDLSPLFEVEREEEEVMRFATTVSMEAVVSKLERFVKFSIRKRKTDDFDLYSDGSTLTLQGQEVGRKGKFGIALSIFVMTPLFLLVEVKKSSGDTLQYNQFCLKVLWSALRDIVWSCDADHSFTGLCTSD